MAQLFIVNHPLVQHKLGIMRQKETSTQDFRRLLKEIALLMGYEATKDLPLENYEIETPICKTTAQRIADKKMTVVPILRAGLGLVDGIMELIPGAKVGHIGLYRDEKTHKPVPYYCKLPKDVDQRFVLVTDPMLATGGSACDAITLLKEHGCKHIRLMCLVAAPEGVKKVQETHPDVKIYTSALDQCLNENAYIVPGLGDAGDRIFGTK
ncbi:MAG: uracil phosphoribosyltransferase [Bacteroidales bacterium]|nr:uracil phosphoribosyltransferase [Bacteroidales bacterium]